MLIDLFQVVAPYELRIFPLNNSDYESMLRESSCDNVTIGSSPIKSLHPLSEISDSRSSSRAEPSSSTGGRPLDGRRRPSRQHRQYETSDLENQVRGERISKRNKDFNEEIMKENDLRLS